MNNPNTPHILAYHNCTTEDRELFFDEAGDGELASIEQEFLELKCLDDASQVNLQGSLFAENQNVLGITLIKCSGASNCKSSQEID